MLEPVCQSLALLAALSTGSHRLPLLLAISGKQGLLSWDSQVTKISRHGPAHPSPKSQAEGHSLPVRHAATPFIFMGLLFGDRPPWASPFIKKPLLALLLTYMGRVGREWQIHRRIFPICPNDRETDYLWLCFPDCWSWEQWGNTIKATVSKHGLCRTMMNGLGEACAYSHSIINCWLADSRQEGRTHSLLEAGLLFLFLAEVWAPDAVIQPWYQFPGNSQRQLRELAKALGYGLGWEGRMAMSIEQGFWT